MLGSCHYTPSFEGADRETRPRGRAVWRSAASPWPAVTALRTIYDALCEGLAASRQYEHLRSRGVRHDAALRQALGIDPSPSQATRETARPIYFAGKA